MSTQARGSTPADSQHDLEGVQLSQQVRQMMSTGEQRLQPLEPVSQQHMQTRPSSGSPSKPFLAPLPEDGELSPISVIPERGGFSPDPMKPVDITGYYSYKAQTIMIPAVLLITLGCSVAALAATTKGWAYYSTSNFQLPEPYALRYNPPPFKFRYWIGWLKATDSLREDPAARQALGLEEEYYLKDLLTGKRATVAGALSAVFLCVSILVALISVVPVIGSLREGSGHWPLMGRGSRFAIFPISCLSIALYTVNILFFAACAVGLEHKTRYFFRDTQMQGVSYVPWPDWAWWLAMVASSGWAVLGGYLRGIWRRWREAVEGVTPF